MKTVVRVEAGDAQHRPSGWGAGPSSFSGSSLEPSLRNVPMVSQTESPSQTV